MGCFVPFGVSLLSDCARRIVELMRELDIPSPIDLRLMEDARVWTEEASLKRPCRTRFFQEISSSMRSVMPIKSAGLPAVLELGSGPGFLAERILSDYPEVRYVALDFSSAMHTLAKQRLGGFENRITYVNRSFRESDWADELGAFDAVVTIQAVHELRHKRHHVELHRRVKSALKPGGLYLVCDHFLGPGGQTNDQLYMTLEEQRNSFMQAGFSRVREILREGGLVLHHICC